MLKNALYPLFSLFFRILHYLAITLILMSGGISCVAITPAKPKDEIANPSTATPATASKMITASNVSEVAAYLAEAGYYEGDIKNASIPKVVAALKLLQKDLGLAESGELDSDTWRKFQNIQLSDARKAELGNFKLSVSWTQQNLGILGYYQGEITGEMNPATAHALLQFQQQQGLPPTGTLTPAMFSLLERAIQEKGKKSSSVATIPPLSPVDIEQIQPDVEKSSTSIELKVKETDPAMPVFKFSPGEEVFVVEKHECKSEYASWIIFYRGTLQQQKSERIIEVKLTERYGLWYDQRYEGVSTENWWCVPRHRFCSSKIEFSAWDGVFKLGNIANFKSSKAIPTRFEIKPLVADLFKRECQNQATSNTLEEAASSFDRVKAHISHLISTKHFQTPDITQVTTTVEQLQTAEQLNAYLKALDPYSHYLTPQQYQFRNRNQITGDDQIGLGLNMVMVSDKLLAVPLKEGPAYRVGFKKPYYLLSLNQEPLDLADFSSYQYLAELSSGTQMPVEIMDTKKLTYLIPVGRYQRKSIEYIDAPNYNIIRIHSFNDAHTVYFKEILQKALANQKPLVFDMRFCPGGSVYAMTDFLSVMLDSNLPVAYLKKSGQLSLEKLQTLSGKIMDGRSLFLWLSPATASAGELFSRALLHYLPDTLSIGLPTKGKCLAQQIFELPNGAALELSLYEILAADESICEGVPMVPAKQIDGEITEEGKYEMLMY